MIFPRDNDALEVNPPAGQNPLTTNGSNWLWAVTAVFTVSFLAFLGLGFRPRHGEKVFHYLFTVALLVGAISYFSLASDLGYVVIGTRQILFAKYIYWVVSFPTIIIALGLISGISWASIVFNVGLSWIWVISYLVSAFTTTKYKWGFFAFGTVAWLVLAYETLTAGRKSAARVSTTGHYTLLAGWANLLWLLYPIAFGLSDAGRRINVTPTHIWFGVLDVLFVPVIGFAVVFLSGKWDFGAMNLHFTQYGRVAQGGTFPEKHATPAGTHLTGGAAA